MIRTAVVALFTFVFVSISYAAPEAVVAPNTLADISAVKPTTGPSLTQQIGDLIEKLTDPDPAVRTAAQKQLIVIGDPARAPLQQAAHSDDPQLSNAARESLAALPWFQSSDPPLAIELLRGYGAGSVVDRIGIIGRLGDIAGVQPVLFRLLDRESNQDVCWQIVAELRKSASPDTLAIARQLVPTAGNSAAYFLAGNAWTTAIPDGTPPVDRQRGRMLYAKAIELETHTPSYDDGQLDQAFDELVSVAIYHRQAAEALRLRREQSRRIGVNRDAFPAPYFALLAIYAQTGPLPGLRDDLANFDRFSARPETLGVLSRVYRRLGSQAMAAALEQCSLATALTVESQEVSGQCFSTLGYSDLAADHFRQILARNNRVSDGWDVQAHLHLSQMATQREDDALALSQLQLLLDDRKANDLSVEGIQQLQTEASVHQLRLAEARHDEAMVGQCISSLLLSGAADTDSCIELTPCLSARGRTDEAKRVFDSTFDPLKKQIDEGDRDPSILNEIAWLSARCDMHLPEALAWAREAVDAQPANSAYLDTNAEACFRNGKAAEAAALERRAIESDSGDLFMRGQLHRFEAAAATQPAEATTMPAERR